MVSGDPDKYLSGRIIDFKYLVDESLEGLSEIVKEIELCDLI